MTTRMRSQSQIRRVEPGRSGPATCGLSGFTAGREGLSCSSAEGEGGVMGFRVDNSNYEMSSQYSLLSIDREAATPFGIGRVAGMLKANRRVKSLIENRSVAPECFGARAGERAPTQN